MVNDNQDKFDPDFPLAHRTDLPERISVKSLQMLEEGVKAVKEGRVRIIDLADDKKWGPSVISKFLKACRLNNIIEKWFGANR